MDLLALRIHLDDIGRQDNPSRPERQAQAARSFGSDSGFDRLGMAVCVGLGAAVWAARAAGLGAGAQCLIEDFPDGAGAAATFRAAAETSIDLTRRAGQIICGGYRGANIVVAEDVTGTNNHGVKASPVVRW
jgi:hypothetical protein